METNNNVITAITLIERLRPFCHARDRAPISARHVKQIQDRIVLALNLVGPIVTNGLVLSSLGELKTLLDTMLEDKSFVETNEESKAIINDKLDTVLGQLYLFAGKYYEDHEFDFDLGLTDILCRIVDYNINNGYYFHMEENQ